MPVRDIEHAEKLAREYRIKFAGDFSPSGWPERHRTSFEAVQKLSTRTFDTYTDDSSINDEPWKAEVRSLASKLREQARRCSYRNESSWRFACEPIILGRMSSEVCCQNCRKRLWRSEIEVAQEENSRGADYLRRRQEAREPCRCPRIARSQDLLEATGLNSIFHYRVDEEVHHSKELSEKLGYRERPDRVYGLRQTRNIENLLYDTAQRHFQQTSGQVTKQVHEVIELGQPLSQTGDRLLFPFLILEAKSGNAGDSWHSIQMQTAFSIRTLLETQERLRRAAGFFSKWRSGPLVWFLANRGEDWRVSMCYTEAVIAKPHTIGTTEYRIVDVWRGSILSRDGALQLLLLVDYIFDWARDKYRNDIIGELRVLASGENDTASTLYVDSDVYSTLQFGSRLPLDEQSNDTNNVDRVDTAVLAQKAFNYDSSAGVVRHAMFVESRFHAILITKDNVQILLHSTAKNRVSGLCFGIIARMRNKVLVVKASDIDDIEWQWTGTRHAGWTYRHQRQPPYHALLSFCTFLDARWHIVRELCVLALEPEAWRDIVSASNSSAIGKWMEPSLRQNVTSTALVTKVKGLQAGSPGQILLSAIMRRSMELGVDENSHDVTTVKTNGAIRRIFHFIYLSAKKGILEPQEPFIRVSRRLSQQKQLDNGDGPVFRGTAFASDDGCVLVTGTCVPFDEERLRRNFCIYLTTGDAQRSNNQELSSIIKKAYETCDVYHTRRNHGFTAKPTTSRRWDKSVWNLKGTYGVHSQSFGFLKLLQKLGGTAPTTQGSRRGPSESGRDQYKRNLAPWQDPRSKYTDYRQRKFISYKILSQEIGFWRSVAQRRRAEGVRCCSCCAAIGSIDICKACQTFLDDPDRYTWMKRCLKGEAPFELTNPSAEEMSSRHDDYVFTDLPFARTQCQGVKKGQDDDAWARLLDFYPRLNDTFDDIQQLEGQWKDYETYCQERFFGRGKRKRSSSESDDSGSVSSL